MAIVAVIEVFKTAINAVQSESGVLLVVLAFVVLFLCYRGFEFRASYRPICGTRNNRRKFRNPPGGFLMYQRLQSGMDTAEFCWTMPCYILSNDYRLDKSGDLVVDDRLRFIAPPRRLEGQEPEQYVAIFTDLPAAETYLAACESVNLVPVPIATIQRLRQFLVAASAIYRYATIDPHPRKPMGRAMEIQETIVEIERQIRGHSGGDG